MPSIGPLEIIVVLVIVLLIFGPKKLPDLGRSLGSGMREFKDSITGGRKDDDDEPSELPASKPKAKAKVAEADDVDAPKAKADAPDEVSRPRG